MHILLAVDGSENSANAVDEFSSRPWPPDAKVRVLHVIPGAILAPPMVAPPPAMAMGPTSPIWPPAIMETRKEFQEQAELLVDRVANDLSSQGFQVETVVREGDARSEIVDEAKQWHADLIVLGSHGYTGLQRLLLGSVAQSVVSHAPCSVEVVRRTDNPAPPPT
jgi:nucleotide-binding universal stress UspA family protein